MTHCDWFAYFLGIHYQSALPQSGCKLQGPMLEKSMQIPPRRLQNVRSILGRKQLKTSISSSCAENNLKMRRKQKKDFAGDFATSMFG